ncbi:hypothetical protein U9M48_026135 [Paspalum notatum var. saurae]|uniref:GDSL esterase/lipase n=1 Tax=Paspalum notatum var. saurae TaxID=547442 RepID=A0AAQ3TS32_PASNO
MAPSTKHSDRAPLNDITDNNTEQPQIDDPRERKRQRDREKYAQMPEQQKQALLQKRREHWQQKKAAKAQPQSSGGADITNVSEALQSSSNTPPTDPVETKRQRERDRYMQMFPRSKEELLKKRCEYRQQKKASLMPDDMEHLRAKDKHASSDPTCRNILYYMMMGYRRLLAMEGRFVLCLAVAISSMISIMQVLFIGVAGASADAVVLEPPPVARRPIFVLGDSTLDVGNNNYLVGTNVRRANMPYYGVDVPGFPTGRWSNGYNTADFVDPARIHRRRARAHSAKYLGFQSSPPPYLSLAPSSGLPPLQMVVTTGGAALTTGVNYASGSAGILASTNAGNTIPLSKQVRYFNATRSQMIAAVGSGAVADLLSKSIVLIGIGGNDLLEFANAEEQALMNRSTAQQQADADAFDASLVSNYSAAIMDLYTMGARKFAIISVDLSGCLPVARLADPTSACDGDRNQLAASFNDNLSSLLSDLASRLPGLLTSCRADTLGLMAATFADPPAYGFTDVATACCGRGRLRAETRCTPNSTLCAHHDRLYFWDYIHPSQRAAFLRAEAFYDGPAQYTTPINFKQLANMS